MSVIRLLALLSLAGLLAACGRSPQSTAAATLAPVATTVVRSVALAASVETPGTVIGSEHAALASPRGGRVTRVAVVAGEQVAKGALLLEVDPEAGEALLADAEARAAAANATAAQAARDFERYRALYQAKAVSPHEFEEIERAHVSSAAAARAAATAVAAARVALGYSVIRAPFAGVVATKNVRAGDFAAPGETLLVLDGGQPQVETQVGETLLAAIRIGETATVNIAGHEYPARVVERVAAADPVTRTHLIKLDLPRDAQVPSGAYASVAFALAAHPALVVPATAVVQRAGLEGVFVVNTQGQAAFRLVRAGATADARTEILAGLVAGERVVTEPGLAFDNGTPVAAAGRHG